MSWTVRLIDRGRTTERSVPYLGVAFLEPREYARVSFRVSAVFVPTAIDPDARLVTARFSHLEKDRLDHPRDPKRIPS